jgi:site-specific DNA recombinase
VAEILNAEGARTRNGALFTGQTIGRLLDDESVAGVPGQVEALVSKELFERCKAILLAQHSSGGARRKAVHLFSGLVFCGCGQKMYVPSNTQKYVCAECRGKIPVDDLEAVFCTQLPNCKLPDDLSASFSDLTQLWPTLSFEDKREIVECVTERIEIGDKKVTCLLISL